MPSILVEGGARDPSWSGPLACIPSPFCTHFRAPRASRTAYTVLSGRTHLNSRSSCTQSDSGRAPGSETGNLLIRWMEKTKAANRKIGVKVIG